MLPALPTARQSVAMVNCTIHTTPLLDDVSLPLAVTNSLFICVTNLGAAFTSYDNRTNASDAGLFATAGNDNTYLASGSSYRNLGTANMGAGLQADLRKGVSPAMTGKNAGR